MFIVIMSVAVQGDRADDFLVATLEMGHAALKEDGTRRFEILRDETDHSRFIVYKATKTRAEHEQHLNTPHAVEWFAKIKPMLMEPMRTETFNQLF
jgi:quinol monooxygenase YgiN